MNPLNKKIKKKIKKIELPSWDANVVFNCIGEAEEIATIHQSLLKLASEIDLSFCRAAEKKQDYFFYLNHIY